MQYVIQPSHFRQLIKQVAGKNITSDQAAAFLSIFGDDFDVAINKAIRTFVGKHFGFIPPPLGKV